MRLGFIAAAAAATVVLAGGEARAQIFPPPLVQKALNKSIPLMQTSGAKFEARMGKVCFSCHHQSLPSVAYANVAGRGLRLDEKARQHQSEYVYGFAARMKPLLAASVRQSDPGATQKVDQITVDPTISVSYLLFGLEADGRKADETLGLAAQFLARKQGPDGRWPVFAARPPLEGSEITCTALAVKALHAYGLAEFSAENRERLERGRQWLVQSRPKSTEDKAYRLLGLRWSGAEISQIQEATRDLLEDQRDDGGWSQLPGKGSDAYATGLSLIALHDGGGIQVSDGAYSRGTVYLFATQQPDGSWRVAKRAAAVQPHVETGFPHGKDQFISVAGTAWATSALALNLPEQSRTARR